jgi:hypothetical protein
LFNSSLHFIGFGRGSVVNSEIIQRLGTFFPETQERYANFFPDLHMTTIDPNDSASTNGGENYFDPTVEVWDNVDFADNYYQTATPSNLIGRELGGADYNVLLDGRAGFIPPVSIASANLLADLGENSLSSIEQPFSQTYDLSVGKFSALEETVAETSLFDNSTTQINSFEESLGNIVRVQRDWNIFFKDNIPQISVPKVGLNEDTALG